MKPTQPWETRLFDTPVGRCAIAWGAHGVLAVQLPDADDAATLRRLVRGLPGRAGLPEPPDLAAAHIAAAHPAAAPPAAAAPAPRAPESPHAPAVSTTGKPRGGV